VLYARELHRRGRPGAVFSYLLVAAGWILATTIAAGIARVTTRR
jgi:hypothetical protein